ncbi:unnamed protein product [Trichogramma brassicae]|uniref:Uncharacterized protein n=1 Tax=Trichogramma brassicae TaxID=86971 RepID=A0A6H5IMN4_9HYME|nr:unnamed protein product [Trichogramma brassicae]
MKCMIFPREFINCPRGIDVLSTLFPRCFHAVSTLFPRYFHAISTLFPRYFHLRSASIPHLLQVQPRDHEPIVTKRKRHGRDFAKRTRVASYYEKEQQATHRGRAPRSLAPAARAEYFASTRVKSAAMCDGQQDQQAPSPADHGRMKSRTKSGSVLAIPTKIGSSPEMIAAAITRKILGAPLLTTKDSPLPTPADFATGSYEKKWTHIKGLVSGLAVFIEGKGNLHNEVVRYTASLVQPFSALSKAKKRLESARPPTTGQGGLHVSNILGQCNCSTRTTTMSETKTFLYSSTIVVIASVIRQQQHLDLCARKLLKPRPAQRRVHYRPDGIVIKAKDATTYADILRTLKSDPTLQQSVGSSVQNIRRGAAGALVLQLKKNVDNASTLGAELDKALGEFEFEFEI